MSRIGCLILLLGLGCESSATRCRDTSCPGDGGAPDGSVTDGGEPLLPGIQLYAGSVGLAGITRGGLAVLVDKDGAVLAVPIAGGAAQTLAPAAAHQTAGVDGDLVMITAPDYSSQATSDFSPLSIWTPSGGLRSLSARSYFLDGPIRNPDATQVVYVDNLVTDGSSGDLRLVNSDGSMQQTLATDVATGSAGEDPPTAVWVGPHLLFGITLPGGFTHRVYQLDAGQPPLELGFATQIGRTDGTNVLIWDDTSQLSALAVDAQTVQMIDGAVSFAEFTPDGDVLYSTQAGELKRAKLGASVTTTVLQTQGIAQATTIISPDGNWVVVVGMSGESLIASTRTTAPPTRLPTVSANALSFTSDSTQALFFLPASDPHVGGGIQTLATSGGSPQTWTSSGSFWAAAGKGSQLLFNAAGTIDASSELRVTDVSASSPSTTLFATPIDWQWFFLTADLTQVAYTSPAAGKEGLYLAPLP